MSRQTAMSIFPFALVIILCLAVAPRLAWAERPSGPAVASWTPDPEVTARLASDPGLLERQLNLAMRKILKDPATLTITITTRDPVARSRGFVDLISVREARGNVDNLVLERADIDFHDVQLDTAKLVKEEKIDVVQVKNIDMNVTILEADLNAFLVAKSKGIRVDHPRVDLRPGKMELQGSTRYGFVKVRFWASGGFSIHDGQEIWFHARSMKMNNLSMPRAFIGTIVKKINPVLNLKKFPFRLNLKEIRIEQGAIHFTSSEKEP